MKNFFVILFTFFLIFSSNGAEVTQNQEYEIEYKVQVFSLDEGFGFYSFYLKPSESVSILLGLIADKFNCKIEELILCDDGDFYGFDRWAGRGAGLTYPLSNQTKIKDLKLFSRKRYVGSYFEVIITRVSRKDLKHLYGQDILWIAKPK